MSELVACEQRLHSRPPETQQTGSSDLLAHSQHGQFVLWEGVFRAVAAREKMRSDFAWGDSCGHQSRGTKLMTEVVQRGE